MKSSEIELRRKERYIGEENQKDTMSSEMKTMIERRLYEASLRGDITSLVKLLEEDPLILEKVLTSFTESPLHIAAMFGHVDFANELLIKKPDLTYELDLHGFSPLHLAASRKNIDMVKLLLSANPTACNITDQEGRTPLHLAAMKGRLEAMKELIKACPEAIQVVSDQGQETILHLCVKHNRLDALKLLLQELIDNNEKGMLGDSSILINSMDENGNTILHLAVAKKHLEMIKFLLGNNESSANGIEINALNKYGFTSLDVLILQSARDVKDIEIGELLRSAGCVRAPSSSPDNDISVPLQSQGGEWIPKTVPRRTSIINCSYRDEEKKFAEWLKNTTNSLMVVASLVATMAFQTGLSPPGGFWQSDEAGSTSPFKAEQVDAHHAGMSVLAEGSNEENRHLYSTQVFFNTIGFLSSLSIILLLLSGLPVIRRKFFVWILVVIMWIAITSMISSYGFILDLTKEHGSMAAIVIVYVWMGLMGLLVLMHFCRFIGKRYFKEKWDRLVMLTRLRSSAPTIQKKKQHLPV